MAEAQYTSAQITAGISAALKAKDMKAVVGLLHLLATVDPTEAQFLLDAFKVLQPALTTKEN